MAAKVLDEEGIIDQDIGVVNKTGGGGAVGWAYVANFKGDPYHLFVASPPIIDVPLNGQSEYDHTDFTPIANIIADYGAFVVKADAKWNTLPELFEDMKKDPSSITVNGSSSPGSMDHLQFIRFAKAYGVDITKIKYVSEQDGGELAALLNGSVDVFSTGVAETVEQVRAGNVKVLAITAEERLEGKFSLISQQPRNKELMKLLLIGEDFLDRLIWMRMPRNFTKKPSNSYMRVKLGMIFVPSSVGTKCSWAVRSSRNS